MGKRRILCIEHIKRQGSNSPYINTIYHSKSKEMKSLIFIPVIIISSLIIQQFLPWWVIAPIAFITCYIFNPGKFSAFAGSFLGIFVLWAIKAYFSDKNFDVPVSEILGGLIGNVSQGAIFFLTGMIGGTISGLSGLLGDWTRQLSKKP